MRKSKIDLEHEKLIEALTIERSFEPSQTPPFGGYNGGHVRWLGYQWKPSRDAFDVVYRNKEGKMHRIYGPAYVSAIYDVEIWYKDGEYHRIGGPAIRHSCNFLWYKDGKLHNLEGPAIIDGGGPKQFWIEGQRLSPKEFKKEIARRRRKGTLR